MNYQNSNYSSYGPSKSKVITFSIIVMVMVLITPTCLVRCTKVDSAEVGIKFSKLSLTEQGTLNATTCSGFVFYNPISTDVFSYPIYIQRVDYKPFTVTTKDAAVFTMDPVLAYQLDRSKAISVFSKYRVSLDEIEAGYMRTAIYDAYRISANKYTSDELMASRAIFESEVRSLLDHSLGAEGFTVTEFTSHINPPESLQAAINAKNQAIQEALKAENEVKKAQANAQIAIAKAEGEAKAMKIKADGEAYYNRTIAASLSDKIIQEDWIEKWDGKLPTYQGGGTPLITLPK